MSKLGSKVAFVRSCGAVLHSCSPSLCLQSAFTSRITSSLHKPSHVCATRGLLSKEVRCQRGRLLAPNPMFSSPHSAHSSPVFRPALQRTRRSNSIEKAVPTYKVKRSIALNLEIIIFSYLSQNIPHCLHSCFHFVTRALQTVLRLCQCVSPT